jgi:hypothetical protein
LGDVQLDVDFEDHTVSAEVLPLKAALIELFSERSRCSCDFCLTTPAHGTSPAAWQFDDLVKATGSLNRGVVIKGLANNLNSGTKDMAQMDC